MPDYEYPCIVKFDGAEIATLELTRVEVDSNLHMPSMFTIELFDEFKDTTNLTWTDSTIFDLGVQVEITAKATKQADGTGSEGSLIKGEITAIEPDFDEHGRPRLLIRGYDKSHRLFRGKKTRTFLDHQDSDIVKSLAGDASLSAEADATSIQHKYLLQNNVTNMEFLQMRAQALGYQVFTANGKLNFKKEGFTLGDGPDLEWRDMLLSFKPRMTAVKQADAAIVRAWDPAQKKAIDQKTVPVKPAHQGGISKSGGAAAKSAFGNTSEMIVTDIPVATTDEAKSLATSLGDQINSEFVQAEGTCFGDPRVLAGKSVNIKGVGKKFSGKYLVTSARHVISNGNYRTHFTISGRQPYTASFLLSPNGSGHNHGSIYGVVPALVSNLEDPENLGRVKVTFKWLKDTDGKEVDSAWARIATPMAGPQMGIYFLPEINDEVLVAFEQGNPNFPYIVGSLWNGKDKPPKPNSGVVANKKVNERMIKSRSGHVISLIDKQGEEQINITDKTGKNQIIIDSKTNTITINMDKDLKVTAKGNMEFSATGNVSMKATGDLALDCKNFKLTSKMKSEVAANTDLALGGKLGVKVEGLEVKLAGQPRVDINNGALEVM